MMETSSRKDKTQIAYCVNWEKDRERTWSGTPWSLRCALAEKAEVVDFDLDSGPEVPRRVMNRLRRALGAGDMDMSAMDRMDRGFRRTFHDGLPNVFIQFGEPPRPQGLERHYVYQDLCVEWLRQSSTEDPEAFGWSGFSGQSRRALERAASSQAEFYSKAAGVFCMGHWFASYLVEHCGLPQNKVHWVGAGCNARPEPESCWQRDGSTFLFVGRDFERKGGGDLIAAFPKVRERMPAAKLLVAGPAADGRPQMGGVTWLGDVATRDLPALFSRADVFVMPSHFEAYGIVFLEASAAGLPIVARNAYEMPYFVNQGENGLLVARDSGADELAEAMVSVLGDPKYRMAAHDRRGSVRQDYSWDAVAQRMLDVIVEENGLLER